MGLMGPEVGELSARFQTAILTGPIGLEMAPLVPTRLLRADGALLGVFFVLPPQL